MTSPPGPPAPAQPYRQAVADYALAGWPCIIPVPPREKFPPPTGFTGAEGLDTDPAQLVAWAGTHSSHSIALRMPPDVIGIDVDAYAKGTALKRGDVTIAEHVEVWGPLPPTWSSTARGDGISRISFYRVPAQRYATKLTGAATGDVEIIQRHHRYAVVWPSPHHELGTTYTWYDPEGSSASSPSVPKPAELAELPPAWVEGLAAGATQAVPSADRDTGQQLLDQLTEDWRTECWEITSARLAAVDLMQRAESGSRHDVMTERVYHLTRLAAVGHTGVGTALIEVRDLWEQLTAGEGRTDELERALLTAARKAAADVGAVQVPRDPCSLVDGFSVPAPAPGTVDGQDPDPTDPNSGPAAAPRWFSPREFIGVEAFDPNAGLDQALAEKVLERTWPMLRYAYDSDGWLLRTPEYWELRGRLSPWAVAQVAPLTPVGDPTAEKGSEPHERAKRHARLMTTGGARAIASKMDDLVAGGMHPATVRLADLDADPEILWAGGMPYSLRLSHDGPTFSSDTDTSVPHLHAAGVVPALVPTPAWDAFLAAVWPDAAVRAWALRVLAIAATGYADRALPILLGETGRGKTQVVKLVMSVLGSYAHAANPKLLGSAHHEHDTIVYALKGRRLSFIDEAPSEAKAGQERLKQLTGGGELEARQMNQDPITFSPTHTFVLTANDEPVLTDAAVRARARLIPCEGDPEQVRLTRAAIGYTSSPTWRAEAPGVLAQLMREAAGWLADPETAQVAAAPEHIRYLAEHLGAEQDPVAVWLAEETEPWPDGTPARDLYQAFVASCRASSMRPDAIPSETRWGKQLTRLGVPIERTKAGKRRPIRVRTGGFLPGMEGPQTPSRSVEPNRAPDRAPGDADAAPKVTDRSRETPAGAQFDGLGARLVHSSEPTVHPQNARSDTVDPSIGVQMHSSEAGYAREETPLQENLGLVPNGSELCTRSVGGRTPKPRSEAATARAAEKRAAARLKAIAEAAGESTPLPVVVTREQQILGVGAAQARELLRTFTGPGGELTVDVETTGYPVGHRDFQLRTVQLGGAAFAVVLDPADPAQAGVIRQVLAEAQVLHAHSATADLVPLAQAGLLGDDSGAEDAWARMRDTVVLAKLDDPASTGSDPGLKQISATMLGDQGLAKPADADRAALFKAGKWLTNIDATTDPTRSGWAQVDPTCATMQRYAASDVLDDAAIATRLAQPEPAVLERERLAQRMTARVAHRGLAIDGDHVRTLLAEHTAARDAHAETVRAAGIDNPGSTAQVGAALEQLGARLPRTRTGKPSAAEAALTPLVRGEGPAADLATAVLAYRHHSTALGLFLEPYRTLVEHGDGRARPTVYTLAADTGRMSCVRPNLQQVPREGGFRACLTADPGHLLVSADFAGVELRVAAALSGDRNLRAILADPERDVHWETARLAFGPNATKADRYAVKRGVFGRIYGGGVAAIAAGVGVTEDVAQRIIDALDALLPELAAWSRMTRDAVQSGRTKMPTYAGRVIHLQQAFPHKAPNYCIQGTARELLVDALVRWSETRWGNATLLPVHDELVVHVPEDEAAAATAALVEAMTSELAGIPIVAEPSAPSFAWQDST